MGCNCTKVPPPEELKSAVGTWKGSNAEGAAVTFVLFGDGSFYYGRQTESSSSSKQGPVNKWNGGSFDSKPCCFCSWHFELEKPVDSPQDGLTMDVNGVKLSYVGAPSLPRQDVTIRVAQNGAIEETLAVVKVHSTVLSRHSKYFKTCMAERWGNPTSSQESSPNRSWEFVLEAQADVDCYLDCFARMNVTPHVKNANRVFHDVKYSLELLKVASQIEFDELMDSTALALSSVYWSEEDEIRIREYTSAPGFPRNHARDLIARLGLDNLDKTELEDRHKRILLVMRLIFRTALVMDNIEEIRPDRAFVIEVLESLDGPAIPSEFATEIIKLFNNVAKEMLFGIEHDSDSEDFSNYVDHYGIVHVSWVLKTSLRMPNLAQELVPFFVHMSAYPKALCASEYSSQPEVSTGPFPGLVLADVVVEVCEAVVAGRLVLRTSERVALVANWHPFLKKIYTCTAGIKETDFNRVTRQLFSTLPFINQVELLKSWTNFDDFVNTNTASFICKLSESQASHGSRS